MESAEEYAHFYFQFDPVPPSGIFITPVAAPPAAAPAPPHDNTADIKQAVLRAVPAYVAEYHTVDGRSATPTDEQISVSQDGPTTAVATMSYLTGSESHEAQFTLRKYDTGGRVEDVQPMG